MDRRTFVVALTGDLIVSPLIANALGITIPRSLLLRADEVIQ